MLQETTGPFVQYLRNLIVPAIPKKATLNAPTIILSKEEEEYNEKTKELIKKWLHNGTNTNSNSNSNSNSNESFWCSDCGDGKTFPTPGVFLISKYKPVRIYLQAMPNYAEGFYLNI